MFRITPAALNAENAADFVAAVTPGGIEAQEAAGQQEAIDNTLLPLDLRGFTRADLEAEGFQFGEPTKKVLIKATLPPGWKMRATDHSMWSDILDAEGVKRYSMFYKAAFYDLSAVLHKAD